MPTTSANDVIAIDESNTLINVLKESNFVKRENTSSCLWNDLQTNKMSESNEMNSNDGYSFYFWNYE